jgi:hypothetical protein
MLTLTDCVSNETGGTDHLTPVGQFIAGIKALKQDPLRQIMVAYMAPPTAPYGIVWVPPANPPAEAAGEVWPYIMHSCGAEGGDGVNPFATAFITDGTFGDPAVRITQFAYGFGNGLFTSLCYPRYESTLLSIRDVLNRMMNPSSCLALGAVRQDAQGNPVCTVTNHVTDSHGDRIDVPVSSCAENGGTPPCWTLAPATNCVAGNFAFALLEDVVARNAASLSSTLTCSLAPP